MIKSIDQVFVNAKHWLLSWLAGWPNWATQVVSSLINILALLAVFLTLFRAALGAGAKKFSHGYKTATARIASGRSAFFSQSPTALKC